MSKLRQADPLLPTRRQMISGALAVVGCADNGPAPPQHATARDRVKLGSTGIEVSRLAIGGGTHGTAGRSDQSRLGIEAFANLLVYAHSQGVTFFDTADDYGTHAAVAQATKRIGRDKVVLLTKTYAQTAADMQAALDKYRTELGTDMVDIVLLHGKTKGSWATDCAGAMDVLAKAKEAGTIRAHGISCHSLEAITLAAETPWVEVDFARINPAGLIMDAAPPVVIEILRKMKAKGKGVVGMKILGEGQLANDLDTAIAHAVNLDALDAFTIGFTSQSQLDEIIAKIATV